MTTVDVKGLINCMSGPGAASVVLTAILCTVENYSADVTLGGVDAEFTSLPLVLIRGPVKLRQLLIAWWQVITINCLAPGVLE